VYGVFDLLYASEFDKWDLAKSVIAETLNDTVDRTPAIGEK